jgi:hypothetical protein
MNCWGQNAEAATTEQLAHFDWLTSLELSGEGTISPIAADANEEDRASRPDAPAYWIVQEHLGDLDVVIMVNVERSQERPIRKW